MRLLGLVVLVFFVVPFSANAGFHLEPYIGKSLSGDWTQGTEGDAKMTDFGVKLGYQAYSGFQIGGELQMGVGEFENFSTADAAQAAFGFYLGYQSSMGLRAYAHYLFSSAAVFDDLNQTQIAGKGFKLGVGYSLLSWLAVNLEYHTMTYDQFKTNLTGFTELTPEFENNFVMVVLSFPFNFGGGSSHESSSSSFR